ncbi:hypothetical protein ColLi_09122 [Colletotrichum liriopes]|uniref:Uncharacterized protein n=1 Tax=Colletotrichum liriopes TaxID=708192 RepID=A0AA37GT10_9PEZI|nr:hypothetical protein ColLi_09122 [Colletotrichum liriopes]
MHRDVLTAAWRLDVAYNEEGPDVKYWQRPADGVKQVQIIHNSAPNLNDVNIEPRKQRIQAYFGVIRDMLRMAEVDLAELEESTEHNTKALKEAVYTEYLWCSTMVVILNVMAIKRQQNATQLETLVKERQFIMFEAQAQAKEA